MGRVAAAVWRLRRAEIVETGLLAEAQSLDNVVDALTRMRRYEVSVESSMYRALGQLAEHRKPLIL